MKGLGTTVGVLAATGHVMTARWHLGPITGANFWWVLLSSPEVLVFLFFMLTDPKTSPKGQKERVVYAVSVGLLAALLILVAACSRAAPGDPPLPGVATVSEVLALLEDGYTDMKFFPAEAAGGAPYLHAIHSPVPAARFCPTGGITPTNIAEYLKTPNVGCVGGSWLTPSDAVDRRDWAYISDLARKASSQ